MRTPTGTRPDRRRALRPSSAAGPGPHPAPPEPPVGRGFAVLCMSVAAGLVANSVCGPLVLDLIDYPFAATIENQLIGLELVSVFLVAPHCLAAGVLALRGHPATGPLAFGPAAYTAYMLVQYVVGPEYAAYVPAAVLQLVLFVLSLVLAVWAWSRSAALGAAIPANRRRAYGLALLALAGFVLSRYASGLVGGFGAHADPRRVRGVAHVLLVDLPSRPRCRRPWHRCRGRERAAWGPPRGLLPVCRGRLVRPRPTVGGVHGDRDGGA